MAWLLPSIGLLFFKLLVWFLLNPCLQQGRPAQAVTCEYLFLFFVQCLSLKPLRPVKQYTVSFKA